MYILHGYTCAKIVAWACIKLLTTF